jgi:hypothetical protein
VRSILNFDHLYVRNYMDWAYKNNIVVFVLQNTAFFVTGPFRLLLIYWDGGSIGYISCCILFLRRWKMKEWIWRLICPILELWTQCLLHFSGDCWIQWELFFSDDSRFLITCSLILLLASSGFLSRRRYLLLFLKKLWMEQWQWDHSQLGHQLWERFCCCHSCGIIYTGGL